MRSFIACMHAYLYIVLYIHTQCIAIICYVRWMLQLYSLIINFSSWSGAGGHAQKTWKPVCLYVCMYALYNCIIVMLWTFHCHCLKVGSVKRHSNTYPVFTKQATELWKVSQRIQRKFNNYSRLQHFPVDIRK